MASQPDDPPDVPSPIDLRRPGDAAQWAAEAMAKRPSREAFFACFASELAALRVSDARILELGSGPGFLARRILAALPQAEYTAFDFSAAMHGLAKERLGPFAHRVRFVEADFRTAGWSSGLPAFHAVVTMQAVHELRHKRHAVALYRAVAPLLLPGGLFLVCDHVCGAGGSHDVALFMPLPEHRHALQAAGFSPVHEVRCEGGLVLFRAHVGRSPGPAADR